jgi:SAM-dependent methyltransferase
VTNIARSEDSAPDGADINTPRYYKKDFWSQENLKFSRPWYRLEKCVRIIDRIAGGRECTLLDVGCGPATLQRFLPPNVEYYGIDIAIHEPAPNLLEVDVLDAPIRFGDRQFDLVIAQGVFEYFGDFQSQKLAEIAQLLTGDGKFLVTYTNFSHRKKYIYPAISNVQPWHQFRDDLAKYFDIDRFFPTSYNWKPGHPNRAVLKKVNMMVEANIPVLSPALAVEYTFICSRQKRR